MHFLWLNFYFQNYKKMEIIFKPKKYPGIQGTYGSLGETLPLIQGINCSLGERVPFPGNLRFPWTNPPLNQSMEH